MDSSVVKIKHPKFGDLYMISTTDFFYPLVQDPYVQGRIACANVLSDLYAMGVTEVDTMLMILGVSRTMTDLERDVVTTQLIHGFNDLAREAGTNVTGGQTVMNPWPIVGGVAMSVRAESEIIRPENATTGQVLVLTKPLGTQLAVNAYQMKDQPARWSKVESFLTRDMADRAFSVASESMSRLNVNGAKLMHKHGVTSATDVTGFGILGHAQNMATSQKADVDFELHTLPVIKDMLAVNEAFKCQWRLQLGFSSETSGGLLVSIDADRAQAFIDDLAALDMQPAWVVGRVVPGTKQARLTPDVTFVEI
ncbi:selenide, water dikinase [Saprolegnia diclina VS20]|uniref:Selenide, water dikinase n=1 Tax=Saprolegnia diclina (strain VS20) TaxID=1156394 RepID=T0QRN1_SAPDV|nr:selenide, water dikinase [Saprolegnia diclina VS20]EQC40799.1 selenide, water dikinase [Saprolegnia diclina VS20]|eukprot:XP_008605643.1 selenide, water dikinase [Saprolegnia diclina VS20]